MSGGDDADVYKTTKQYEEDRQKYTVKEMEKLRQYYIQVRKRRRVKGRTRSHCLV